MIVKYYAHPTMKKFHQSDKFVRGLMGCVGGGKSVACCWEIFRRMQMQKPSPFDGKRRSRWAIIRNTYRELTDTTLNTWNDWFGRIGRFRADIMTHYINYGDIEAEVMFRALDRPKDAKKLLSLELTGAWVNEAREVPITIVDLLQSRLGRYPAIRDGGCTWYGLILDTNPPDTDHWWYKRFEEQNLGNWNIFKQPSALSPQAENLENLPKDYYTNMMSGKDDEWVKVYVKGEYGMSGDGRSVYPEYVDTLHTHNTGLKPSYNVAISLGWDYGLTPACVIGQVTPEGRLKILDELIVEGHGAMGIRQFAEDVVIPHLKKNYKDWWDKKLIESFGDPAGNQRAQTDEKTCMSILADNGLPTSGAYTNEFITRRDAVAKFLIELVGGKPRMLIDPKCNMIRKGFGGSYYYERVQVAGDERYKNQPVKNHYSHIHDALQYLCMMSRPEIYVEPKSMGETEKRIDTLTKNTENSFESEVERESNVVVQNIIDELGYSNPDDDGDLRETL